jgi:hypothetical protein
VPFGSSARPSSFRLTPETLSNIIYLRQQFFVSQLQLLLITVVYILEELILIARYEIIISLFPIHLSIANNLTIGVFFTSLLFHFCSGPHWPESFTYSCHAHGRTRAENYLLVADRLSHTLSDA